MKISRFFFLIFQIIVYLCTALLARVYAKSHAQMAELVDALVSNTSGATHPGSIPGLGTEKKVDNRKITNLFSFSEG